MSKSTEDIAVTKATVHTENITSNITVSTVQSHDVQEAPTNKTKPVQTSSPGSRNDSVLINTENTHPNVPTVSTNPDEVCEKSNDLETTNANNEHSPAGDSKMKHQENVNAENSGVPLTEENTNNMETENCKSSENKDVNTQNMEPKEGVPPIKNTNEPESTHPKEDWSSLMFSSDDSLFEEWTQQVQENKNKDNTNDKHDTAAAMTTSTTTSNQDKDTLPDIVLTGKKLDAITGLLMLGKNTEHTDDEINNELLMPVDKPKQPDITVEQSKKDKRKKK